MSTFHSSRSAARGPKGEESLVQAVQPNMTVPARDLIARIMRDADRFAAARRSTTT